MAISGISFNSNSLADTATTQARAPVASRRSSPDDTPAELRVSVVSQAQVPLRFPWMSRVQLLMEQTAQARRIFSEVPVIGGNLDKSA